MEENLITSILGKYIGGYQSSKGGLSLEEFVSEYENSYFLVTEEPMSLKGEDVEETQLIDIAYLTQAGSLKEIEKERKMLERAVFEIPWKRIAWGTAWIGRAGNCNIRLYDPGISKGHAGLKFENGRITCIDMKSSNGTFINGKKLIPEQKSPVNSRDVISFARVAMVIYSAEDFYKEFLK